MTVMKPSYDRSVNVFISGNSVVRIQEWRRCRFLTSTRASEKDLCAFVLNADFILYSISSFCDSIFMQKSSNKMETQKQIGSENANQSNETVSMKW